MSTDSLTPSAKFWLKKLQKGTDYPKGWALLKEGAPIREAQDELIEKGFVYADINHNLQLTDKGKPKIKREDYD